MMRFPFFLLLFSLISGICFGVFSCQKKFLCEDCGCKPNEIFADAGPDLRLYLPVDSVVLTADTSKASYFKIVSFAWRMIAGPTAPQLINEISFRTVLNSPAPGSYQIELLVTDACDFVVRDTVEIIVSEAGQNRPPVADAGPDITDTLPTEKIILNGSASSDPDQNISSYSWRLINGSGPLKLSDTDSDHAIVSEFRAGTYLFELTVADSEGLLSRDTVKLLVLEGVDGQCVPLIREQAKGSFIRVGNSNQVRSEVAVTVHDNLVFFAGGYDSQKKITDKVDVWNADNDSWSQLKLSSARNRVSAVTTGNKVFFAGGYNDQNKNSSRVDIYDLNTNTWTIAELSVPRHNITTAVLGDRVFFIGGSYFQGTTKLLSNSIDIYSVNTNSWTSSALPGKIEFFTANATESKLFVAGGSYDNYSGPSESGIFVYDATTDQWQLNGQMVKAKFAHGSVYLNGKLYWAGGYDKPFFDRGFEQSCLIEVRAIGSQNSEFINLSAESIHPKAQAYKGRLIFFRRDFMNETVTDIYSPATNSWITYAVDASLATKLRPLSHTFIYGDKVYLVTTGDLSSDLSLEIWRFDPR